MYLLLQRDLQLFRLATTHQLNEDELWDCADSHIWIQRAIEFRVDDLASKLSSNLTEPVPIDNMDQIASSSSSLM